MSQVHCDEPDVSESGGGAVLQQTGDSGAVDQRRKASSEDDAAQLSPVRSNEVRLWLTIIAYNLGNLWRRLALPQRIGNWSLTSLQQRFWLVEIPTPNALPKQRRYESRQNQ